MSHVFEMQIERLVPGTTARAVAQKVVSRVFVAPAFLSANFGSLAVVRGEDAARACVDKVPDAWYTGTVFWPAFSIVQRGAGATLPFFAGRKTAQVPVRARPLPAGRGVARRRARPAGDRTRTAE